MRLLTRPTICSTATTFFLRIQQFHNTQQVYMHRCGGRAAGGRLGRLLLLVATMDLLCAMARAQLYVTNVQL
jgi:hypothetical protein